jgi:hypothetical protein
LPENWTEPGRDGLRLRQGYRKRLPQRLCLGPDGRAQPGGRGFWFLPGAFGFCPRCLYQLEPRMRERSKLFGLSAEGRSSATTTLVSTALAFMNAPASDVPQDKRKLLGFTDNRQDAALQAGHFNGFLFVSQLRGGLPRAVLDAGGGGLAACAPPRHCASLPIAPPRCRTGRKRRRPGRRRASTLSVRSARYWRIGYGLICGAAGAIPIRISTTLG